MRVLFLNPSFPPDYTGGAEVAVLHTLRGLRRRGVDCYLLTVNFRSEQDVDEWYTVDQVPVHRVRFRQWLPGQELFDVRAYRAIRRELASFRPALVHIHNISGMSFAGHVACRHAGLPVVNTVHDLGLLCPNNMRYRSDETACDTRRFPNGCGHCFRGQQYWAPVPTRRKVIQHLTRHVRLFLGASQAQIDRHVDVGYAAHRFRIIPHGVEETPAEASQNPRILQLVQDAPNYQTIVFAGGGVVSKGARVVLEAMPQIVKLSPALRVVVAGGGPYEILQRFHRFAPQVHTVDRLSNADMRALYACADLSLIASTWNENSPVVIYESFLAGVPVVGSMIGGTPELIEPEKTGYLFPVGDGEEMVRQIQRHFAKTPSARRQMRLECVKKARRELTLDQHIDAHIAVYEAVLKGEV